MNKWSDEDRRKLWNLAKDKTHMDDVYEAFPNRSPKAVLNCVQKMGLSHRNDILAIRRS